MYTGARADPKCGCCYSAPMGKLGILVGGGPAPGINSVIGAATIRACLSGAQVIGIHDGYRWLMDGDTSHVSELTIAQTGRIHFRGGSFLGISRANPTKEAKHLANVVRSLEKLGVDRLISIGGDGTSYCTSAVSKAAKGKIKVVHVPKTIDNDISLPSDVYTFGFQTARHVGVDIVQNLMVDAKTTSRWYFVVAMGRTAGHLALGIGKAAGATLSLIPEEFDHDTPLASVVDVLAGAIIKRLSQGRSDGVALLAEGLAEVIRESDLRDLVATDRDAHGYKRVAEVDIGMILRREVEKRLASHGISSTIVSKNIGYELRCADPIPFDMEYTRDLGYAAARYVLEGGDRMIVNFQSGIFNPIPFDALLNPDGTRMRVRLVDLESDRYKIAHTYMLRIRREDFDSKESLNALANVAKMSAEDFRAMYGGLIDVERRSMILQLKPGSP